MRVLLINVVCGIKSTGRICTDLASALEEKGHEVKIAYGRENVPSQYEKYAVKIGSEVDTKIHAIKARVCDDAGFESKKVTKRFIEWIRDYNPDIIHLHNLHGYYINVEILFDYLKTCNKNIIWTLHDCWAFTGHAAYCDYCGCEKWENGCNDCVQKKEYPKSFVDFSERNWRRKKKIFTGLNNMIIVTPSNWLTNLTKKSYLSEYQINTIHNGIDTTKFFPIADDFKSYFNIENKYVILGILSEGNEELEFFTKLSSALEDKCVFVLSNKKQSLNIELPNNMICFGQITSSKEWNSILMATNIVLYGENNKEISNIRELSQSIVLIGNCDNENRNDADNYSLNEIKYDVEATLKRIEGHLNDFEAKKEGNSLKNNKKTEIGGFWNSKAKYGLIGKKIVLGIAANWDKRKGLDDILRLSNQMSDNIKFVIVGVNEKQTYLFNENVIGITKTNNVGELAEIYSIADVFVNPTYEDNYPTTNIEAIACGTPVITYETGGSAESAGMFGTSVPRGDINAMSKAVKEATFVVNPIVDIDYRNMVKHYIDLYESYNCE